MDNELKAFERILRKSHPETFPEWQLRTMHMLVFQGPDAAMQEADPGGGLYPTNIEHTIVNLIKYAIFYHLHSAIAMEEQMKAKRKERHAWMDKMCSDPEFAMRERVRLEIKLADHEMN